MWSGVPQKVLKHRADARGEGISCCSQSRNLDRKSPKVISLRDPQSAWTAKANKPVQFGYELNYLIDIENVVIVDVKPTHVPTTKSRSRRRCSIVLATV